MKFYLAKSLPVSTAQGTLSLGKCSYEFRDITTDITQYYPSADRSKWEKLKEYLDGYVVESDGEIDQPFDWKLVFVLGMTNMELPDGPYKGYIKLESFEGNCLQGLSKLSNGRATITAEFTPAEGTSSSLVTTNMTISETGGVTNCSDYDIKVPVESVSFWRQCSEILTGCVNLTVTLPDDILREIWGNPAPPTDSTDLHSLNRLILEKQIQSDVLIVAGDGAEVLKAHKAFLAAQSTVFATMFDSETSSTREHTIEMPDMSVRSVQALLKFLYCQDVDDAVACSTVAYQLLYASHKYDIKGLKDVMTKLMEDQQDDWFQDVDVAVKLFILARKFDPVNEQLKTKAAHIMKINCESVNNSVTYQQLLKYDTTAMDLCKYAFTSQ